MIKINEKEIEKKHFPDNSQMLLDVDCGKEVTYITWQYESDEECMTLWYLAHHIREVYGENADIILEMFYVPNARMDRTKSNKEVFTLKYFADFINSLHFNEVVVMDAHSNVSLALINRVTQKSISGYIEWAIEQICKNYENTLPKDFMIYFPDDGAMKRYKDLFNNIERDKTSFIYGKKERDWATGKIKGISIHNEDGDRINKLPNAPVLMIDDIISYGGTLAYSADTLKALGAGLIYAYATHVENSILDEEKGTLLQRLKNNVVEKVFTTNSLYSGNYEKIEVI